MLDKAACRQALSFHRSQLKPEIIREASEKVASQLMTLPEFIKANKVAVYIAVNGELDPNLITQEAEQAGKSLFLPVISDSPEKNLLFYPYSSSDTLTSNRYGIPEPKSIEKTCVSINELDLVLIPLVAFDEFCSRLGRGSGYYDRCLSSLLRMSNEYRPVLIGLGYEFQKIETIPPEIWDIPMDFVVTEEQIYRRAP